MTTHIDTVDRARLKDVARLQENHGEKGLSADERAELLSLVGILLRRHAGTDDGAQAAVDALLAHADTTETIVTPTIAIIIKAAQGARADARRAAHVGV